MIFPGFVGPSYQSRSPNFDAQRTVNLYPEVSGSGSSKSVSALFGTPGISIFITLPAGAIRGMLSGGNRMFAVAGVDLYEVFSDQTYVDRSLLGPGYPLINDGNPVVMAPNGNQLGIASGGVFYCDSGSGPAKISFAALSGTVNTVGTSVLWESGDTFDQNFVGEIIDINGTNYSVVSVTSATLLTINTSAGTHTGYTYSLSPSVRAGSLAFLDGYFIVSRTDSKQFYISALNDGTSWDYLDYASKEAYPDNIGRLFADHEQLWIFGKDQSTEVWQNTGAANFPFQRIPGAVIDYGCSAPYSVCRLADGVAWLAIDVTRGGIVCVHARGFIPVRISTSAIENTWAGYTTIADAVSYSYIENGHNFLAINFPTGNATWVYDTNTNQWHERGWWNGSANVRQRQEFHSYTALAAHGGSAFVPSRHFVGDWENGKIYIQSLDYLTDNAVAIHRSRSCPHLANENKWIFYSQLLLDLQVPSGGPATINPILDWSDDGGSTFGTAHPYPGGSTSSLGRATQVRWRRLGRSKDRVFRVSISDAVPIALIAAYLELTVGNF